ncbi:MAG: hypothetical protein ABI878_11105 [Acidobacteriota bacterium]
MYNAPIPRPATFVRSALVVVGMIGAGMLSGAFAQSAAPSPTPSSDRFDVTASVEGGVRGVDVNGSGNKFRSDLNYRPGFRIFDSSFMVEDHGTGQKLFDTLLVTASGFNADPTGAVRLKMEKKGDYEFDGNYRTVKYFNNLNNFALNEHNADYRQNFGDMDLTVWPEREKFRMRFGYSFNRANGTGSLTTRAYSDEFPVSSVVDSKSDDVRAGIEGKLWGFNYSLSEGYRVFHDDTAYSLLAPNLGNNPINNGRLFTFTRQYPIRGTSAFTIFSVQRTFAKKLDFTTRWIYSITDTTFTLNEFQTGRDNSNNQVTLDQFNSSGNSNRPQTRGDIGLTWSVTDKLRISDTFSYDHFTIGGNNLFAEALFTSTAAGVPRATVFTNTLSNYITRYRRLSNLVEADYQVNNRFGFNVGWRFGHRNVEVATFDRNFASATPTVEVQDFNNPTNSVIAGMKIKPLKAWTIYGDVEYGRADNVFTRLANYNFTNFRVRSRTNLKKFAFNLSAIVKNNNNPGRGDGSNRDFAADSKSRIFASSLDYTPIDKLTFSGGYTYNYQTSQAAILVPINSVITEGISQYFVRDSYAFFDVTANPIKRVSLYISYRIDKDSGQGSLRSTRLQDVITSYPMRFHTPEAKLAVRLTRNIDWNLGYQFYDYGEVFQTAQNYRAHLPYTSLRIHWGTKAGDRFK